MFMKVPFGRLEDVVRRLALSGKSFVWLRPINGRLYVDARGYQGQVSSSSSLGDTDFPEGPLAVSLSRLSFWVGQARARKVDPEQLVDLVAGEGEIRLRLLGSSATLRVATGELDLGPVRRAEGHEWLWTEEMTDAMSRALAATSNDPTSIQSFVRIQPGWMIGTDLADGGRFIAVRIEGDVPEIEVHGAVSLMLPLLQGEPKASLTGDRILQFVDDIGFMSIPCFGEAGKYPNVTQYLKPQRDHPWIRFPDAALLLRALHFSQIAEHAAVEIRIADGFATLAARTAEGEWWLDELGEVEAPEDVTLRVFGRHLAAAVSASHCDEIALYFPPGRAAKFAGPIAIETDQVLALINQRLK